MNVTSKISVDLTRQNVGQRVNAVQGDGNTRLVEITLLSGGAPWTPPDGVEAAIAYMQPSGTKGMYNLLADGTAAISITGNVATAVLAPQMLTVSGTVQASLVFNDQRLNRLTTFPFAVSVASNPAAGAQKVEDYLRLQWLEDKLDEYVKKIIEGIVPGGAVSSVNGKTGAVVLTAGDVHALPDNTVIPTVPEKVSAFENDAGYLTEHQDISGKVDKVAGKGLSTHDYDNAAKAKVDAIPEDPKYTDTVYDDAEVKQGLNQLKADLTNKIDKPSTAPEVGKILKVLSVNEDGTFTCEWGDAPDGGGASEKWSGMKLLASGTLISGTEAGDYFTGVTYETLKQYKRFVFQRFYSGAATGNWTDGFGTGIGDGIRCGKKFSAFLFEKIEGTLYRVSVGQTDTAAYVWLGKEINENTKTIWDNRSEIYLEKWLPTIMDITGSNLSNSAEFRLHPWFTLDGDCVWQIWGVTKED